MHQPTDTVSDTTLEILVKQIAKSNLVALNCTLDTIYDNRTYGSYAKKACRIGSIAERVLKATQEVGICCEPFKKQRRVA